jgi:hypothetical protein
MRYTLHYDFNILYKQKKEQWINTLILETIDIILTGNPIQEAL